MEHIFPWVGRQANALSIKFMICLLAAFSDSDGSADLGLGRHRFVLYIRLGTNQKRVSSCPFVDFGSCS